MAVGFDTPLGGLALEMAYRNMEAKKKAEQQGSYEQELVGKRLMGTGSTMSDYQNVWDRGYGGAQKAATSQAQAYQDYWTGLPEIMVAAAKEGQSTGGGGGGGSTAAASGNPLVSVEDILRRAGIIQPPHLQGTLTSPTYTNPDTAEARARVAARQRAAVKPTYQRRSITPQMGR